MKKTNFLKRHLVQSEEGYFEHFMFSFTAALWLILTGVVLAIHAILPFAFITRSSKNVRRINKVMQKRFDILKENAEKKEE